MAEALIDGIGNAYKAEVTSDNELKVTNKKAIRGETDDGTQVPIKVDKDGKLDVSQSDLYTVFTSMLKELQKINLQLSMINDYNVKGEDVPY